MTAPAPGTTSGTTCAEYGDQWLVGRAPTAPEKVFVTYEPDSDDGSKAAVDVECYGFASVDLIQVRFDGVLYRLQPV